jgi:site-specific recombinase XerC
MLFDRLVTGGVLATNPAHALRGPKHVVERGKTPVLTADQARALIESIDTSTLIGLRDRALIGVMTYAFARIDAVVGMRVEDYFANGKRWWVWLHEKGGKLHEMPAHHKLEAFLDEYIKAAEIGDAGKSPLFRSAIGRTGTLTSTVMNRVDVYRIMQRRAADLGMKVRVSLPYVSRRRHHRLSRSRRHTGKRPGDGGAESPRTTKLYDRTGDEITLHEVERITI